MKDEEVHENEFQQVTPQNKKELHTRLATSKANKAKQQQAFQHNNHLIN